MPEKTQDVQSDNGRGRRPRPEGEVLDLHVVYEDESLMALVKPAGMVVHPTYKHWSGTLLNGLIWYVRHRVGVRPRIVTRLDKDTSGLVLVALMPEVQARFQWDAAAGRVTKEYLAVVRGTPTPSRGTIALPLARSSADRRRVIVTPSGRVSETNYDVLSIGPSLSLLRCELVTGRTHQIRVHLASSGWPIVGDAIYGTPGGFPRQALHAWRLSFTHPLTGEAQRITAPLPADIKALIEEAFGPQCAVSGLRSTDYGTTTPRAVP